VLSVRGEDELHRAGVDVDVVGVLLGVLAYSTSLLALS